MYVWTGVIYFHQRRWSDAHQVFEEVYNSRLQVLGAHHSDTLLALELYKMTQSKLSDATAAVKPVTLDPVIEEKVKPVVIYAEHVIRIDEKEFNQVCKYVGM